MNTVVIEIPKDIVQYETHVCTHALFMLKSASFYFVETKKKEETYQPNSVHQTVTRSDLNVASYKCITTLAAWGCPGTRLLNPYSESLFQRRPFPTMNTTNADTTDTGTSYEDLRAANIRRNEEIMRALGRFRFEPLSKTTVIQNNI
jgi:flagellar biosynthesis/type III secretory pathway M-ring protein FliF/YscJ